MLNIYNGMALVRSKLIKWKDRNGQSSITTMPSVDADDLPTISVLIAAYHEASVIGKNLRISSKLRYPKDKLELIIITEEGDAETRAAIAPFIKRYHFIKSVIVPQDSIYPKGKPRALNLGLIGAKGEIIGVLDAEDIIEPDLLLKVAQKITFEGYDVVQGVLDPVNEDSGWFSLMERAEYGYWYRHYLEALEKSGYPMPLGGTTNFLKRSILDEMGGWEAGNLTEDFALGMRLFNANKKVGMLNTSIRRYDGSQDNTRWIMNRPTNTKYNEQYKVGMLNAVTREESPPNWLGWHRQRTRWQQGKIQTFRNYVSNPPDGFTKKLHVYIAVMQPHIAFMNLIGISLNVYAMLVKDIFPYPLLLLTYLNFCGIVMYCVISSYGYLQATDESNKRKRLTKALLVGLSTPIYWLFQWASDIRAAKREYINQSTEWFKTEHEGPHMK